MIIRYFPVKKATYTKFENTYLQYDVIGSLRITNNLIEFNVKINKEYGLREIFHFFKKRGN